MCLELVHSGCCLYYYYARGLELGDTVVNELAEVRA